MIGSKKLLEQVVALLEKDSEWNLASDQNAEIIEQAIKTFSLSVDAPTLESASGEQMLKWLLFHVYSSHLCLGSEFTSLIEKVICRDRFIAKRSQTKGQIAIAISHALELIRRNLDQWTIVEMSFFSIKEQVVRKTMNRLRTVARPKKNQSISLLGFGVNSIAGNHPQSPESRLIQEEYQTWLQQCLNQLKNDQRTAVKMRYSKDASYSQISSAVNRSESSVRQIVRRAKRKLRECLLQKGMSPQDLP